MMTGVVVTAPLSDNVFHAGAVGYGWLNAGWGTGAFLSVLYAPQLIAARGRTALDCAFHGLPGDLHDRGAALALAGGARSLIYAVMGSGRGVSGVAMNTSIMEQVPQHFMGRVQNTFYFAGTPLQIVLGFLVGAVAQWNLVAGFSIIGMVYAVAFATAVWPVAHSASVRLRP